MLISMPTGTSTIFGVFQTIGASYIRHIRRDIRAELRVRLLPPPRKCYIDVMRCAQACHGYF
jgi:hypothetical protein